MAQKYQLSLADHLQHPLLVHRQNLRVMFRQDVGDQRSPQLPNPYSSKRHF